jgi:hypothetical protein
MTASACPQRNTTHALCKQQKFVGCPPLPRKKMEAICEMSVIEPDYCRSVDFVLSLGFDHAVDGYL